MLKAPRSLSSPTSSASLLTQTVENLSAMQEIQVQFLGQEDRLGNGMATHSSILAWRIPWTEEPRSPWGCKESDTLLIPNPVNFFSYQELTFLKYLSLCQKPF